MKTIEIRGHHSSGKTMTMNILLNLLKVRKNVKDFKDYPIRHENKTLDFKGVILYNERKVALISCGDMANYIEDRLDEYSFADIVLYTNAHFKTKRAPDFTFDTIKNKEDKRNWYTDAFGIATSIIKLLDELTE